VRFAYLDASALAKRYIPETGTAEVNHLFSRVPTERMIVLTIGMAEVVSLLVRKRNAGRLTLAAFRQSMSDFSAEIAAMSFPVKLTADDRLVAMSFAMIEKHSVNSTDGILLQSALELVAEFQPIGHDLILVTSDKRLLKAASAEGIHTFDPETQSATALDAFLGP